MRLSDRQPLQLSAPGSRFPALILAAACAFSVGCTATDRPTITLLLPQPNGRVDVASVIDELPMDGSNIVRKMVSETEQSTAFLVRIEDREFPHRHTKYDLTVVVVEGSGTLWLDGKPLAMATGDIAHVPRDVAHHFVNAGSTPASALAIFSPRFEGPDSVPIEP